MKIVLYLDHDSDNSSMSRNSEAQLQVQKCRPDLFSSLALILNHFAPITLRECESFD